MNQAIAQRLAQLPPFESLLRDAYDHGEIVLHVYHDGIFDEDQFLLSGRLSVLERQGLVILYEAPPGPQPDWTDHQMRYGLTPQGRRIVETAIVAVAADGA
jgi:hypothetical protein